MKKYGEKMFTIHKTRLFLIAIPIVIIFIFAGCSNETDNDGNTENIESYDYSYDLENGLKLQIKTNEAENDLFSFKFEFNTENSIFKSAEFVDGSYDCYLKHNLTEEIIKGFGDISTSVLYFENVKGNLSEYSLHIECPIKIRLNEEYPFSIILKSNEIADNNIIELPLDNSIKLNNVSTRQDFDKFSDKCVDVTFLTSSENIDFDIRIEKSQISTGAPVGDFKQISKTEYVYSHPIYESETEISISVIDVSLQDMLKCDINM